jgi:hypothetical protein
MRFDGVSMYSTQPKHKCITHLYSSTWFVVLWDTEQGRRAEILIHVLTHHWCSPHSCMCLSVYSRVQTSYSRTWTDRTKFLLTAYRHLYSSLIVNNDYRFVQKVWTSGGIRNWPLFKTKWRVRWVYFPRVRFRLENPLFVNSRFWQSSSNKLRAVF